MVFVCVVFDSVLLEPELARRPRWGFVQAVRRSKPQQANTNNNRNGKVLGLWRCMEYSPSMRVQFCVAKPRIMRGFAHFV